jgi:hypothetical protein
MGHAAVETGGNRWGSERESEEDYGGPHQDSQRQRCEGHAASWSSSIKRSKFEPAADATNPASLALSCCDRHFDQAQMTRHRTEIAIIV